jgi:hypothetical protein
MDGGELSGSRSGRITFKASTTDASWIRERLGPTEGLDNLENKTPFSFPKSNQGPSTVKPVA